MRILIDKDTGNLGFLTFINSNTGKFTVEYEWGEITYTINKKINPCVQDVINKNFIEIGYL